MNEAASDTGILAHTPVTPKKRGRISRAGIRNITWRVSDKKMAFPGFLMAWKKLEVTRGRGNKRKKRKVYVQTFNRQTRQCGIVCKQADSGSRKNWAIINARTLMQVAHNSVNLKMSVTRLYCCAP